MWLAIVLGDFPDVPDSVTVRYPVPTDVEDYEPVVDDVAAAVDRAVADHPGLPVVLVGDGIGGMVAVRYTQRYPDPVGALVLVAPVLGPWTALDQLSEADVTGPWSRRTLAAIEECLSTIDFDHPLGDDLPALWLHGDDDALVPVSDTRAGMDRIRGLGFRERIYPGVLDRATAVGDVAAFLAQLSSAGAGSS